MGMRMEIAMAMRMGIKFELSDEEALHYLFDKAAGRLQQPYTVNGAVTEQDLYGDKDPWEVFMEGRERPFCNQEFRYFYTNLKRMQRKKHGPGERFLRTVGKNRKGTWSGVDKPHQIFNYKGQLLGFKKCYAYENKGSPQHGRWLMKEYSLDGPLLHRLINIKRAQGLPVPDLVLCRINENVKLAPRGGGGGRGRGKQRQVPPRVEEESMIIIDQEEVDPLPLPLPPIDVLPVSYFKETDQLWSSNCVARTESTVEKEGSCLMEVQIQPTSTSTSASPDQPQPQSSAAASASASTSVSAVWGLDLDGEFSDRYFFNVDDFFSGEDWEGSGSMEGQVQTTSAASVSATASASASTSAVWGSSSAASASAVCGLDRDEQFSDPYWFNVGELLTDEDVDTCKRLLAEDQP